MFILLKLLTSALTIVVITEIAKRHSVLGGLISVMPINIILSLIWLNLETKNLQLLTDFTKSALIGIIPTILFLLSMLFFLGKHIKLSSSVTISLVLWVIFIVIQNKYLGNA